MGINGNRCTVCDHPDRASIELGLANKVPIRVLGKRYNVHHDAVYRHGRNHMPPELHTQLMTRGRMTPEDLENLRVTESEGVLQHIVAVRARLYGLMDVAEQQTDYKAAASIGGQILKNLEITAKLLGDLKTGTVNVTNNLLVMPEFHALRTSIMVALRGHPDARADVIRALQHFQSPDLPNVETTTEREAAGPELAKARDVTRRSRAKQAVVHVDTETRAQDAKREAQVIEGESKRVRTGA